MSMITHGDAMRYARELGFLIEQLDGAISDTPSASEAVSTDVWTQSRAALMPRLANLDAPLSGVTGSTIINSIQTIRVSHRFFRDDTNLYVSLPTPVAVDRTIVLYGSGVGTDLNSSDYTQAPVLIELLSENALNIAVPYIFGSSAVVYEDTLYVVEFA